MLELEVFILEFLAVNRFAASSVVIREIAALAHETRNDSVEDAAFVAVSLIGFTITDAQNN